MLGKIFAVLIIVVLLVALVSFIYEPQIFCNTLSSITNYSALVCGSTITAPTTVQVNSINPSYVSQYRIAPYESNISKVQPGITAWKSFANYTSNQKAQLNSLNVYSENTSDEYLYYKPENVYSPYSFTIIGHYYSNGTFSNYNPSLIGKVVNISFSSRNTNPGYSLQYVITNITIGKIFGENKMVTWYLRENFGNISGLVNFTTIVQNNESNEIILLPMGLYFKNGTEIVLPNKG